MAQKSNFSGFENNTSSEMTDEGGSEKSEVTYTDFLRIFAGSSSPKNNMYNEQQSLTDTYVWWYKSYNTICVHMYQKPLVRLAQ